MRKGTQYANITFHMAKSPLATLGVRGTDRAHGSCILLRQHSFPAVHVSGSRGRHYLCAACQEVAGVELDGQVLQSQIQMPDMP